jgi:uncharacterized membrane protein
MPEAVQGEAPPAGRFFFAGTPGFAGITLALKRGFRYARTCVKKPNPLFHLAYVVTIAVKGIDGAIETMLGLVVLVSGPVRFNSFLMTLSAPELTDGENGFMRLLHNGAAQLIGTSVDFVVIYLLLHGLLKLALALVLLTGKGRWVYPVATVILLGFLAFMSWHLAEHWSNWVMAFALFDLVTLLLVLNEWRNEKTQHLRHQPVLPV